MGASGKCAASDAFREFPKWRGVSARQWHDWRWQTANLIRSLEDLEGVLPLDGREKSALAAVAAKYHFALTPYYASLIRTGDPDDPIRRQSVPLPDEEIYYDHERSDPLAEEVRSPVPGLTHRYPDRALLVTTNYCYMYCRHCTRKRIWTSGETQATRKAIEKMIAYVAGHKEIRDVIISGGDPLTLPQGKLEFVLSRLRDIDHVDIIRIGSRVPVVMPMRIDSELVSILGRHGPLWLNTQFNHPREVTAEAAAAVDRLLRAGIPVNNQSVLLRGVNDRPGTMVELNQALLRAKIRPYYLFQCDPVIGAEHFRTSIETGLEIMENLRGRTSGLAIPSYVIDLPGGGGKVPVTPNYIVGRNVEGLVLRNFEGKTFTYPEPRASRRSSSRRLEELVPAGA